MPSYGQEPSWQPARPRLNLVRLLGAWIVAAASVYVAAGLVPGFSLERPGSAFLVAAAIALFNAVLPPLVAALRLPWMLGLGFVLVLGVNALALVLADDLLPSFGQVDSFGIALLAALIMAAVAMLLQVMLGTNDRRRRRAPRRSTRRTKTGHVGAHRRSGNHLSRDRRTGPTGLAARDAGRERAGDGALDGGERLPAGRMGADLSSQTGASQAGILLGSNEDIPAFRWVEKETGTMMVCSSPEDCAEIERRHSTGIGLLADGARAAGTCSREMLRRRSSRSVAWRRRRGRTPATGPSSPTVST